MTDTAALYQFAHGRTGDKGNRSNISVIAYDPRDYDHLVAHVTEDAVRALFRERRPTAVTRFQAVGQQRVDGIESEGKRITARVAALSRSVIVIAACASRALTANGRSRAKPCGASGCTVPCGSRHCPGLPSTKCRPINGNSSGLPPRTLAGRLQSAARANTGCPVRGAPSGPAPTMLRRQQQVGIGVADPHQRLALEVFGWQVQQVLHGLVVESEGHMISQPSAAHLRHGRLGLPRLRKRAA